MSLQATAPATRRTLVLTIASLGVVFAASFTLFGFLLVRFPFDGLYGQDSYAYYYQARELWSGIWGTPSPTWPFASEGLYHWPVGYHLLIMAGFFLTGEDPTGGRLLTLALAALQPVFVALLARLAWRGSTPLQSYAAGVAAGLVMLTAGVYTRAGLTLMADIPTIFWATASMCCLLQAWPPGSEGHARQGGRTAWAVAFGAALGLAILTRYISALFLAPVTLYLLIWYWKRRAAVQPESRRRRIYLLPVVALAACLCSLLPQVVYSISRGVSTVDTSGAIVWRLDNFLRTTMSGPDGTATYTQPMAQFYFVDPLIAVSAGFLSPLYLPALALGLATLLRGRQWGVISLLLAWWLVPAAFFSGGLYQAHRFIVMYLPPIALLVGVGAATALGAVTTVIREKGRTGLRMGVAIVALVLLAGVATGVVQSSRAAYRQVTELANIKSSELAVVAAARQAASEPRSIQGKPRAVVFGISAALYHYTGWQILDIYNHDESEMARFLTGDGPMLAVVPERSMTTQWAATPSGERWAWLQANYALQERGSVGDYKIYRVSQASR